MSRVPTEDSLNSLYELLQTLRSSPKALLASETARRRLKSTMYALEYPLTYIAARPVLAFLTPGLLCLILACIYVLQFGYPLPSIHDEFSYLLGADTFASGRLANPTHPMWVYFESPHIIHVPTYVSMYHPGQALFLAAGQVVAGHPWYGVLASCVLMCIAIGWALRAWLPPGWALLGGLLSAQIAVFGDSSNGWTGYWIASYWGGALGATGGALVVGALGRFRTRIEASQAVLFVLGAVILAITRPFEGLLLTGSASIGLLVYVRRQAISARLLIKRGVLPAAVVVASATAMMSYYCWRTTGKPTRLPYQENLRQYMPRRMFVWGESQPKTYRHAALGQVYEGLMRRHLSYRSKAVDAAKRIARFYFGPVLMVAVLIGFPAMFQRRIRLLLVFCLVVLAGLACLEWVNIHYASPIACTLIAVSLQCLRYVRTRRWHGLPFGQIAVCGLVILAVLFAAAEAWKNRGWHRRGWPIERERIQSELMRSGGEKHLILVRYSPTHDWRHEWVYNGADLDGAPIVWAREMQDNKPLLDYYEKRQAWLLEPDVVPPRFRPYPR